MGLEERERELVARLREVSDELSNYDRELLQKIVAAQTLSLYEESALVRMRKQYQSLIGWG
jgi:hypothetical protein